MVAVTCGALWSRQIPILDQEFGVHAPEIGLLLVPFQAVLVDYLRVAVASTAGLRHLGRVNRAIRDVGTEDAMATVPADAHDNNGTNPHPNTHANSK